MRSEKKKYYYVCRLSHIKSMELMGKNKIHFLFKRQDEIDEIHRYRETRRIIPAYLQMCTNTVERAKPKKKPVCSTQKTSLCWCACSKCLNLAIGNQGFIDRGIVTHRSVSSDCNYLSRCLTLDENMQLSVISQWDHFMGFGYVLHFFHHLVWKKQLSHKI